MVRMNAGETSLTGGAKVGAGWCHHTIEDVVVKEYNGIPAATIVVETLIVASTNEENVDKKFSDTFFLFDQDGKPSGNDMSRLLRLGVAVGMLTEQQWEAAKKANADIEFDETLLPGRQYCSELKMVENKRKELWARPGFRMFALNDPMAIGCPKHPDYLAMVTGARQNGGGVQQPVGAGTGGSKGGGGRFSDFD